MWARWRSRGYGGLLLGGEPAVESALSDADVTADPLHLDPALGDETAHETLAHTQVSSGLGHREQRIH